MPTRKRATPKEVYTNDDLPILYVDTIDTRRREDGVTYLSFATNIPDRIVEQVRIMVDGESLRGMIDDLCRTSGYFPVRPAKKQTSPTS